MTDIKLEPGESFDFSLYQRNQKLFSQGVTEKHLKTGTTIAAAIYKDGVILGADTRATAGPVVQVKDEMKLHYVTDNIFAAGAGTAADCDEITRLISSQLQLYKLNTGIQPRIDQAARLFSKRLFNYGGHIQAYLLVAGVDFTGPSIYSIYADGAAGHSPFAAEGSGSLAAISVLESKWKVGMNEEECKDLIADAILAGITNDLGSGSNINLCVITKDKYTFFKNYRVTNQRNFSYQQPINIGEAQVLKETTKPLSVPEVHLEIFDGQIEDI